MEIVSSEKLMKSMKMKGLEVDLWLSENGLPKSMKPMIMENVRKKLEGKRNDNMEILSVLPLEHLSYLKRCLCLGTLNKVPKLREIKGMDDLKGICELLKPMIFAKDTFILREGEPIDMIIFISLGIVRTYTTPNDGIRAHSLKKGNFYGEELVSWASRFPPSSDLPISKRIVRSLTKVECFALMADDLKNHVILKYFWWQFTKDMNLNHLNKFEMALLEELALASLGRAILRLKKRH
ncbi:hypothetical protein ABKV19_012097 [Rosa sericea]